MHRHQTTETKLNLWRNEETTLCNVHIAHSLSETLWTLNFKSVRQVYFISNGKYYQAGLWEFILLMAPPEKQGNQRVSEKQGESNAKARSRGNKRFGEKQRNQRVGEKQGDKKSSSAIQFKRPSVNQNLCWGVFSSIAGWQGRHILVNLSSPWPLFILKVKILIGNRKLKVNKLWISQCDEFLRSA